MKIVFALAFALFGLSAHAAPVSTCFDMRMQVPDQLDGSGKKTYLTTGYKLCVVEDNVVKTGAQVYSGKFIVQIRDGGFLQKAWPFSSKGWQMTVQNETRIYAGSEADLSAEPAKRVTISLLRNHSGKGAYLGQISIGGSVYALFGL